MSIDNNQHGNVLLPFPRQPISCKLTPKCIQLVLLRVLLFLSHYSSCATCGTSSADDWSCGSGKSPYIPPASHLYDAAVLEKKPGKLSLMHQKTHHVHELQL